MQAGRIAQMEAATSCSMSAPRRGDAQPAAAGHNTAILDGRRVVVPHSGASSVRAAEKLLAPLGPGRRGLIVVAVASVTAGTWRMTVEERERLRAEWRQMGWTPRALRRP